MFCKREKVQVLNINQQNDKHTQEYQTLGELVRARAKLGPLDKSDSWAGVRGNLNKLTTHLLP